MAKCLSPIGFGCACESTLRIAAAESFLITAIQKLENSENFYVCFESHPNPELIRIDTMFFGHVEDSFAWELKRSEPEGMTFDVIQEFKITKEDWYNGFFEVIDCVDRLQQVERILMDWDFSAYDGTWQSKNWEIQGIISVSEGIHKPKVFLKLQGQPFATIFPTLWFEGENYENFAHFRYVFEIRVRQLH